MIRQLFLTLIIAILASWCWAEKARTGTSIDETARTEDGTFHLWHRLPAEKADVKLPMYSGALTIESFAYRVRDRKRRDVVYYARIVLSTAQPITSVVKFYQRALGKEVQQDKDDVSGEIVMTSGTADDFRLVTLTPKASTVHIRLERVQRFAIEPRAYTTQEKKVMRVLDDITRALQSTRVHYSNEQRTEFLDESSDPVPPVLSWTVDIVRPNDITVSVSAAEQTMLTITTQEGNLKVSAPGRNDEIRPITDGITLDLLPEFYTDPVAWMVLGDTLITPRVDYMTIQSLKDVPPAQGCEIVLTYPDNEMVMRLIVNIPLKRITHCELEMNGEGERKRIIRDYANYLIEPPQQEESKDSPPQQPSQADPAAVTAP